MLSFSRKTRSRIILMMTLLLVASLVALVFATNARRRPATQETASQSKRPRARSTPRFETAVPEVEIVSATVQGDVDAIDANGAILNIEVRNNTNKPVTYFRIVSGESGVTTDGGLNSDIPEVILPPYGTTTVRDPMATVTEGDPLKVTAVEFAGGEARGPDRNWIAIERASDKKERARRDKGGQP
jgi:hypothetical protein